MSRLAVSAALLLLSLCFSTANLEPTPARDVVEVLYKQAKISSTRGSSVTLSCQTQYFFSQCGLLHAAWKRQAELTGTTKYLTEPRKYLTTVTEKVLGPGVRSRQIVTEILDVTPDDAGTYQCEASCETGDSAEGHFIEISVRD